MPRPVTPNYVVPTWAPNASYPVTADPWSATPTKTTHPGAASVGITPKTAVAAQVLNKVVNDAYTVDASAKTSLQALYDHAAQTPALNWFPGASIAFDDVAWNGPRRTWIAVGNGVGTGKIARESYSHGQGFAADTLGALGGASGALRVGVDATGNMVVTAATSVVYEYAFTTNTWTYQASAFSMAPAAGDAYAVVHDGTRWVAYTSDAANRQMRSSTDRVTWTNRTTTIASSAINTMSRARLASNGSGRVVSCAVIGVTGVTEFMASTDGFATLVTGTYSSVNHGMTTLLTQSLTYSAAAGLFIFTCSNASSGRVYTSTDGLTWSLVTTLATGRIQRIATHGEMWVAYVGVGSAQLAVSLDRGVTWRAIGWWPDAFPTLTGLASSGEQFMITTTAGPVFYSARTGIGLDVLT